MRVLASCCVFALLVVALSGCGEEKETFGIVSSACSDVEYGSGGGTPAPDVLIVSDLPLHGAAAERSRQQNDAIRAALSLAGWKAGTHQIAFQACDDSLEETGAWDAERCRDNARNYAENENVWGVIGTYNSGCAAEIIPILNQADNGPVAMVSPGNTWVCLTEEAKDCEPSQLDTLYPNGARNYVRVVPNDADQAAALATYAKQAGISKPVVLYAADDPTSTGQAEGFANAAKAIGIAPLGSFTWDPEGDAPAYRELMRGKVQPLHPNGIVLAGLTEQNGAALIKAKVEALGANETMPLLAFDGFAQQSTIDEAGDASAGMVVTVPGRSPEALTGAGEKIVDILAGQFDEVELFAPYAAQAVDVLLAAIAASDADRSAAADALLEVRIVDGVIGSFAFEPSGDPTVRTITALRAGDTFTPLREIVPDDALSAAARG